MSGRGRRRLSVVGAALAVAAMLSPVADLPRPQPEPVGPTRPDGHAINTLADCGRGGTANVALVHELEHA